MYLIVTFSKGKLPPTHIHVLGYRILRSIRYIVTALGIRCEFQGSSEMTIINGCPLSQ